MSEFKTIETQEELDRIIGERLGRQKAQFADYDDLKVKATKYDEAQARVKELEQANSDLQTKIDEDKQSLEGYQSKVSEFETKISGYETEKMKVSIALNNGLPLDLASRLQGTDEQELKADAERLAGFMNTKGPTAPLKSTEPVIDSKDASYRSLVSNLSLED